MFIFTYLISIFNKPICPSAFDSVNSQANISYPDILLLQDIFCFQNVIAHTRYFRIFIIYFHCFPQVFFQTVNPKSNCL